MGFGGFGAGHRLGDVPTPADELEAAAGALAVMDTSGGEEPEEGDADEAMAAAGVDQ